METRICKVCGQEKEITAFIKNVNGYTHVCHECSNKKKAATWRAKKKERNLEAELAEAKTARLQDFSPRELMSELHRRGYEGTITYTETHTINLATIR